MINSMERRRVASHLSLFLSLCFDVILENRFLVQHDQKEREKLFPTVKMTKSLLLVTVWTLPTSYRLVQFFV